MPYHNTTTRKQRFNLTLNKDLVTQARTTTDNLSAVVESLLAQYVTAEAQHSAAEANTARETVATWNRFAATIGSFADEHSTL